MDKTLARSKKEYHQFILDMYAANLIDFTHDPIYIVTPVFLLLIYI